MDLQNIGASNKDDAFYRYKMPKMITKVEGRGNGIKTNVVNMVEIAKALARPPSYAIKYFGCELGAQSKFDEKTGTSLVNGAHDTAKLAALLENFIKKYVQCYGCGNPETDIVITKTQMINLKCAACGFVSDVDMRDKLTTFILKNPPEPSKNKKALKKAEKVKLNNDEDRKKEVKKKGASTITKENAQKGATAKKKNGASDKGRSPPRDHQADENEHGSTEDDEDDVQWQTDTSLEAARQRIQEQLSAVTADMVMLSTNEDKKSSAKESIGQEIKEQNGAASMHEKLVRDIKDHLKKGSSVTQLKSFLDSLSNSTQEIMDALFVALFDGIAKGFAKEVVKKKSYLAVVTQDAGTQILLLDAIESFCEKASSEVMKEVALVLKALYDNDLLEEESIVKWYEKGLSGSNKKSQVWKNAKPFIEWLQNAESESE